MLSPLRGAVRSLVRHPAFVATASGTLALGIAAAVALFSAVNAALLRPLPFPRSADIYSVRTFFPSGRFTSGLVAMEELRALQRVDGVPRVVILSDPLWRSAFGSRGDIVGSSVMVAGTPARVIGVANTAMNVP